MTDHIQAATAAIQSSADPTPLAEATLLIAEAQAHATLALAKAQEDTAAGIRELAQQQHLIAQAVYLGSILEGIRGGDRVSDAPAIERLAKIVLAELIPAEPVVK